MHSNIIWAADTNYRIDLDNDTVRPLAEADDFDTLVSADQVRLNFTDFGDILMVPRTRS